jgi:hypothetical protein
MDKTRYSNWFIAIDPGWKNFGVVVGNWGASEPMNIIDANLVMSRTLDLDCSNQSSHQAIKDCLDRALTPIRQSFPDIGYAILEHQYYNPWACKNTSIVKNTVQMQILQSMLFSWFSEKKIKVEFVQSSVCKGGLNIATGNYTENKRAALAFVRGQGLNVSVHHEADAFIVVHWWLLNHHCIKWRMDKSKISLNWFQ